MSDIPHKDKRFVQPNGEAIERLSKQKGLSLVDLAREARVSFDTIKRVARSEPKQPRIIGKIAAALGVKPVQLLQGYYAEMVPDREYSWDDIHSGAKKIGEELFKDGNPTADAVLTFPGPSSLFTGFVLSTLPLEEFIRIPVYTAILVNAKVPVPKRRLDYFCAVKVGTFNVLLPRELIERRVKKIVVIDDTIITGATMRELRKWFAKKFASKEVRFACCICHDAQTLPVDKPPEIIGLQPLEKRLRFPMPWGRDAFCNEEGFLDQKKIADAL